MHIWGIFTWVSKGYGPYDILCRKVKSVLKAILSRFLWILRFRWCLVEKSHVSHLNISSALSISEINLFRAMTSTLISSGSIFVWNSVVPSLIRDPWTIDTRSTIVRINFVIRWSVKIFFGQSLTVGRAGFSVRFLDPFLRPHSTPWIQFITYYLEKFYGIFFIILEYWRPSQK